MPLNEYYDGHGSEVMRSMTSRYGKENGRSIFYATHNKRKKKRKKKRMVKRGKRMKSVSRW